MEWIERTIRRLRLLLRGEAVERSMRDEMEYHIERETADGIQRGMSPGQARRAALLAFGGVERFKEEARDARGVRLIEDTVMDVRYALRVLRRNPAFTIAAVLTFALGVGAATAIFSIVHHVVLRPLPYEDPDRLVALWERNVPRNRSRNVVSVDTFEAWRDRTRAFEGMAALVPARVTLLGGAAPERVSGAEVSPGYLELLGVMPLHGRGFLAEEGIGRAAPVVILSHGLWTRWFGADPAVVGRTLPVAGEAYTIVGVMPREFAPPQFGWLGPQEFWIPFAATAENRAWGRFLLVVARLKRGVSLERARAELDAIATQRAAESPGQKDWGASLEPLAREITGHVRGALLVLLAAVGLLLLVAVVNVATLLQSLMRRRRHELAIRRSLGATEARLFRQLFVQSATLGIAGSAAGVLTAVPILGVLVLRLPADLPRSASIAIDGTVLLVTAAVTVAATLLFGTLTARAKSGGAAETSPLRFSATSRISAGSRRGALVSTEIALGLALGVVALLMVRSVIALQQVDLGFQPGGVVAGRLALPGDRYPSPASRTAFFDALLERVRGLPAVQSAGLISARPLGGFGPATSISDPSQPLPSGAPKPVADIRFADAWALRTLRIPVAAGRLFEEGGNPEERQQAVISETAASTLWPETNPIGRHVEIGLSNGITAEVVGVARDVHLTSPRTPPRPTVYLNASRFPDSERDLVVLIDGDSEKAIPSLRAAVAGLDPTLPLFQVSPMSRLVDAALARERFTALVLGAFAAIALALAGVGIFGVCSGEIAGRRKELGIRLALGATERNLIAGELAQTVRRAAIGIAAGSTIAFALSRSMAALLFGVRPHDPASFLAVALLLLVIAATATLLTAVRAFRASPLETLREG